MHCSAQGEYGQAAKQQGDLCHLSRGSARAFGRVTGHVSLSIRGINAQHEAVTGAVPYPTPRTLDSVDVAIRNLELSSIQIGMRLSTAEAQSRKTFPLVLLHASCLTSGSQGKYASRPSFRWERLMCRPGSGLQWVSTTPKTAAAAGKSQAANTLPGLQAALPAWHQATATFQRPPLLLPRESPP